RVAERWNAHPEKDKASGKDFARQFRHMFGVDPQNVERMTVAASVVEPLVPKIFPRVKPSSKEPPPDRPPDADKNGAPVQTDYRLWILITTTRPYSRQAVENAILVNGVPAQSRGKTYLVGKGLTLPLKEGQAKASALYFVTDRIFLVANIAGLE